MRAAMARCLVLCTASVLLLTAPFGRAIAQESALAREMAVMRDLREKKHLLDASDYAISDGMVAALHASDDEFQRDVALWEIADIHLSAASQWAASNKNRYARRAIEAWTRYVEFAIDRQRTTRIHPAVEYLQRSYLQNVAYMEMFSALVSIPAEYVNDKVVTRWQDRLRTCPGFAPPRSQPWPQDICAAPPCREAVSNFQYFMAQWIDEFNLRESERRRFSRHVAAIPQSCN